MAHEAALHAAAFDSLPHDPHVIVFTAVGKTGSATMAKLFKQTRAFKRNQVQVRTLHIPSLPANSTSLAAQLASVQSAIAGALESPVRHIVVIQGPFPDLPPDPRVAFISAVRQPVDRCVSTYYYGRFGAKNSLAYADINAPSLYAGESLDTFVASASVAKFLVLCPRVFESLTFCGWSAACNHTREELAASPELEAQVLELGMANMVSRYALVGVTEDLRAMAQLLECRFPAHFDGLVVAYDNSANWVHVARGKHPDYILPNAATTAVLEGRLTHDVELYALAQTRFRALLAQGQSDGCHLAGPADVAASV